MRRSKSQAGFTIIEIMSIVAILGILAVITIPSIRVNTARAKIAEALLAFGPCRNMITELYASGGDSPGANNWGCEIAGNATQYVDSITTTDDGVIMVLLRNFGGDLRIQGRTLTLAPLDASGNLATTGARVTRWRCGSPADGVGTDVYPQYLPATCRGG